MNDAAAMWSDLILLKKDGSLSVYNVNDNF